MRQHIAIARAMITDPVVMLGDEPTGNLDREAATATMQLLRRLVEEFQKTLIVVTHDLRLAEKMGRIVAIEDGRIRGQ